MTRAELLEVLDDLRERVAEGDSFEGFIQYLMPTDEIVPEGTEFLAYGRYRFGNRDGQGRLRAFGRMHDPPMVQSPNVENEEWLVPDLTAPDEPPDSDDP